MATEEGTLERELEDLLEQERFQPPDDFVNDALVTDLSMHEEAEKDPAGWWLKQTKELLDWFEEPTEALDESNPPFYKWFKDGKINVSYNCLDRHVDAGNGDRVAFHWRGEEGEERDVTYSDLLEQTQRIANGLKKIGVEDFEIWLADLRSD